MSGSRATIAAAVLLAAARMLPAEETPHLPPAGELKWVNGDAMRGALLGFEDGWLRWQAEDLAEPVRVWLPRTTGWQSKEPASKQLLQGAWSVRGMDGGFFACSSSEKYGALWVLHSTVAGEVKMGESALLELRRLGKTGPLLYSGPSGGAEFIAKEPAGPGEAWESGPGGVMQTRSIDQELALPLSLPDKVRVDWWLRTTASQPQFRWRLRRGGQQLEVETWMEEMVGLGEGRAVKLGTQFEPASRVALCVDFPQRRAVAYDSSGRELGHWKVRGRHVEEEAVGGPSGLLGALAEAVAKGFKQRMSAAQSGGKSNEAIEGISLVNLGQDLTLERLLVREWNGEPPGPRPQDAGFVETLDGSIVSGEVKAVSAGRVILRREGGQDRELSLEEVAWLQAHAERDERLPQQKDADPPALPAEPRVELRYRDGSIFFGRLEAGDAATLNIATEYGPDSWRLSLAGVDNLRWLVAEPNAGPPTSLVAHLDVWEQSARKPADGAVGETWQPDRVLHGTWEPAAEALPRWRLDGADSAALMRPRGEWLLRRSRHRLSVGEELPGLAHLRTGEVLPVEVKGWSGPEAEFRCLLSAGEEGGGIALESLLALELPGKALATEGFADAGWAALQGTDSLVKHAGGGQVVLQPGAMLGHGSFLQGSGLRFDFGGGKSHGALRVRLFCNGLQVKPGHSSLVLMRSGTQVYAGMEQPERPGEIRGSTNRAPADFEKPARVELSWASGRLEVRVNAVLVVTHPLDEKSRSGSGVIFEPATLWGNPMREQTLAGLQLESLPGARARPALDAETRQWALQVPRLNQEDPPRHLLLAHNGDVLRGSIESLDATRLTLRAGLEQLEVPRERVAVLVMPRREGEDPASPSAPNADAEGLWVSTTLGAWFRMKPSALGPERVEGTSARAGRIAFPAEQIAELTNRQAHGRSPVFGDLAFVKAPQPQIETADVNPGGPALGSAAPEFELELAGGGRFRLQEQRGRVVVLDFWASWCGPCIKAMPEILAVTGALPPEKVRLVGVNQGQSKPEVLSFLQARGWPLEAALDLDQKVGQRYGVKGIPHTVVIDPDGNVAWVSTGHTAALAAELEAAVKKCMR